ncbi:MAG TPA: cell division protein ZapA [Clostridiaceae bacterium]|nr:cell division protein ZapA [Clostridiaceae bacterium]
MNAPVEQIQARIGKITYQLTTSDDPQKMRDIAATADAMMNQVAKKSPQLNQVAQAVLALVNAVSLMEESYEKLHKARAETELAIQTAEEIKAELIRQRELFWQMKKELLYYRNLCEIYETKLSERAEVLDVEEARPTRRTRRGRKLLLGDLQMTIEDALMKSDASEIDNDCDSDSESDLEIVSE